MSTPYPRDLIGYGGRPPHAHWPGEARIAVNFVIHYEEGSEYNVHDDGFFRRHLAPKPACQTTARKAASWPPEGMLRRRQHWPAAAAIASRVAAGSLT